MVRTKEKKAKGDSAFTKRKQKVGRKKLAPATATRAEVHARTLRIATSAAMSAAIAAPQVDDPSKHPPSSATTTAGQKAAEGKRKGPVIVVQNFSDLLSGTHHYKSAQRASAFATLTRLLTAQKEKDEAAATGTRAGPSSAFDEYMRHAATENVAVVASTTSPAKGSSPTGGLSGLTALEKLKAFAAALEAVTDTDDDVRRGALQSLEVLMDYQWISPDLDETAGTASVHPRTSPSSLTTTADTQDAGELEHCNALLLNVQAGNLHEAERVASPSYSAASTVSVDRVKAILQSVHVALTHALKPVRFSGVELLALLLRVAPPALVRAAARAVFRHQTSYYNPSTMGSGLTMAGMQNMTKRDSAGGGENRKNASESTPSMSVLEAAQAKAASLEEEEEKWMLTLIRRVSTLVLRTKYMAVLPALLVVFLGQCGESGASAEESMTAELLRSCLDERSSLDAGRGNELSSKSAAAAITTTTSAGWCHPELVNHFFDEITPQWANHWKELMELRLELLRQEEKLAMASALARSFAAVLVFLKRQQQKQQRSAYKKRSEVNFFSRNRMYHIKALFTEKTPVTMQELLVPSPANNNSSFAAPTVSPRGMKARLELGLALVMVCTSLASTDEGWSLMRDYFSIVFSLQRKLQAGEGKHGDDVAASTPVTTSSAQSFRFPSVALLQLSVGLYEQVLRLYPCTAAHVHLADDDEATAGASEAAAAAAAAKSTVWGGSCTTPTLVTSPTRRASRRESASSAAQQQQHSTVAIRLISFFPALLNTVIKHLVPRTGTANGAASSASRSEDAALVRTLLCTSHILERLAAFPDDLLRGRESGSGANGDSRPASRVEASDGSALAKKLEEGFSLVPRLLFALREQTLVSRPATGKRPREDDEDDGEIRSDADSAGAAAVSPPPVEKRVGVLLAYPGVVDAVVRRLLRVLWFLSSSGHPLIINPNKLSATPFALLLKKSIFFLFGNPQAGVAGVLQRCATPTVLLAHSSLYYLGADEDNSATVQKKEATGYVTSVEEAAAKWAEVVEVLRVIRM